MEFVEGETLADRIARGPIPVDEALPIAKQIAEGLEDAHLHYWHRRSHALSVRSQIEGRSASKRRQPCPRFLGDERVVGRV